MNAVVYFVTVNYYSCDLIKALLDSISATGSDRYHVVIVNNSPQDTSVNALAGDRITVLTAECNLGFGSGCNLGMEWIYRHDPNSAVWLINPDAQLTLNAVDYVRRCLAADPTIAILGTRICDLDGQLWFSHGRFNPWLGILKHRDDRVNCDPEPVVTHPTHWVSGCSMIFHLPVFDHCPRFDPQFFLDYEDAEISVRYYRLGYRLRITQGALVNHQVSAITLRNQQAKFQHATFSKLYLLHRHASPLALGLNLVYTALKPLMLWFDRPDMATGRWLGLRDFVYWRWRQLQRLPGPFHPRTSFTATPSLESETPQR